MPGAARTTILAITVAMIHGQGRALDVPAVAGRTIVLDGHVDSTEWAGAATLTVNSELRLRLLHDDRHLYVAFIGQRFGFNSLCSARGDSVRVLHASAALGAVTYARSGDAWTSRDTAFSYAMRSTDTTTTARAERAAYLAAHGWVANTVRMGNGLVEEFQVALSSLSNPPRIANARFIPVTGGTPEIQRWPITADSADGCFTSRLVSGYVPAPLRFEPGRWVTLRLQR